MNGRCGDGPQTRINACALEAAAEEEGALVIQAAVGKNRVVLEVQCACKGEALIVGRDAVEPLDPAFHLSHCMVAVRVEGRGARDGPDEDAAPELLLRRRVWW